MERFSQNYLREKVRGRRHLERAEEVVLALQELQEAGYIEPDMTGSSNPPGTGRPRSPVYRLRKEPKE